MEPALHLDGTFNLRDAGAAGPGPDGPLRRGVLYRSGMLSHVTDLGLEDMKRLGITDVIDLRSDQERDRDGVDRVAAGVDVHTCPLNPEGAAGGAESADTAQILAALSDKDGGAATARAVMIDVYRGFVTQESARTSLARALQILAAAQGACLVHCSAGKDRTGWYTAVVLGLCGVAQADIEADYLASNDSAADLAALLPPMPGVEVATLGPVLGVQADYLRAAQAEVRSEFGDMSSFLDSVGVTKSIRLEISGRFGRKVP